LRYFKYNRIRLFTILFERYSKFTLTESADRSAAIFGLEERLASALDIKAGYGIFERYLYRNLLWQRSENEKMKWIEYLTNRKMPSWSWIIYNGEINYINIKFRYIEWSDAIDYLQNKNDTISIKLKVPAREFLLDVINKEKRWLIFDKKDRTDIQRLKYIIIERSKSYKKHKFDRQDKQEYYILIIALRYSKEYYKIYKRIGINSVQKRYISFNGENIEVRIIWLKLYYSTNNGTRLSSEAIPCNKNCINYIST
jgi:hypothetical protein